jgi:hypothetical protein
MAKVVASLCAGAALALLPIQAFAEQGDSSSWGSVGWGPVIPTQALSPKDRQWNQDNQAKYQAESTAEWVRLHGRGLFPLF